jgi:hypothetical protein
MQDSMIVQGPTLARAHKAGSAIKEVGLMNFVFQPDLFERSHVRDADGSITRRGFTRGAVIPGLGGKCAHARSWVAELPVKK